MTLNKDIIDITALFLILFTVYAFIMSPIVGSIIIASFFIYFWPKKIGLLSFLILILMIFGMICAISSIIFSEINLFFISLMFIIIAFVLSIENKNTKYDIFNPWIFTLLFFSFAISFKGMDMVFRNDYWTSDTPYYLSWALFYNLIGLLSLLVGYYLGIGKAISGKIKPLPKCWSNKKLIFITIIFFLSALLIFYILIKVTGFNGYGEIFANMSVFRIKAESGGLAYLRYLIQILLVLPLFAWFYMLINKDYYKGLKMWIMWIINLFIVILILFPFGIRGILLWIAAGLVASYSILKKRISLQKFLVISFIGVILLISIGLFRGVSSLSFSEFNLYFTERLPNSYNLFIARFNALPTFSFVIENFDYVGFDYQYGKSILGIIFRPVPRTLYPDKPYETSTLITNNFLPEASNQHVAYEPSLAGEMYINLGIAAIIIGFVTLGIFNRILQEYYFVNRNNIGNVFFNSLIYTIPATFLAVGFDSGAFIDLMLLSLSIVLFLNIISARDKCNLN